MTIFEMVQAVGKFFSKLFKPKATIRRKSSWQNDTFCINHLYGVPGCKKSATHEAFYQKGEVTAAILCCSNPECQERASDKAVETVEKKT